jgi:chemotaxis protein methyltransferase CheR
MSSLTQDDFDFVRQLVRERSAIVLEDGKGYLAESRLGPVAKANGLASIEELVARLRAERFGGLHTKVVEAMTTNETSFFRDVTPFDALRNMVLPDILERRKAERSLRIWSGACSSGQEPYTLTILLREYFPTLSSWDVRILATDLSTEILGRAREGKFSQLEVNRGLPVALLVKYFTKRGVHYQVNDDLRGLIEFRPMNLAEPWPVIPPMDVIFLRNVLIYFDVETKREILGRMRRVLKPDGYLFLGGAETTINLDDGFERLQYEKTGCYRLRQS